MGQMKDRIKKTHKNKNRNRWTPVPLNKIHSYKEIDWKHPYTWCFGSTHLIADLLDLP